MIIVDEMYNWTGKIFIFSWYTIVMPMILLSTVGVLEETELHRLKALLVSIIMLRPLCYQVFGWFPIRYSAKTKAHPGQDQ